MKLIVGLGNPGKEYENTRHNVGFMTVDNYCTGEKFSQKFNGLYISKNINGEKVIFLKPQSYMNLSGMVVRAFVDYFDIDLKDVLVIRDDLDLPVGTYKIKFNSSSGGDNGIKSIIQELDSQMFGQLKIGISNDKKIDTKDYVLGKFSKSEMQTLDTVIKQASEIIDSFISNGIDKTMNIYNGVTK